MHKNKNDKTTLFVTCNVDNFGHALSKINWHITFIWKILILMTHGNTWILNIHFQMVSTTDSVVDDNSTVLSSSYTFAGRKLDT